MPIHRVNNRGKLQTPGTLMTFSANVNGLYQASINFKGFGATEQSTITNSGSIFITTPSPSVVDNFSNSSNYNQGFYLNGIINMTIQNTPIHKNML